jgi:hypothetical protein
LPAGLRAMLPTNSEGQPQVEIVQALYRYESPRLGEVRWIEVRELTRIFRDLAVANRGRVLGRRGR